MVMTRGFGSGVSGPERPQMINDEIRNLISTRVTFAVREAIIELFRSIKTTLLICSTSVMLFSLMLLPHQPLQLSLLQDFREEDRFSIGNSVIQSP